MADEEAGEIDMEQSEEINIDSDINIESSLNFSTENINTIPPNVFNTEIEEEKSSGSKIPQPPNNKLDLLRHTQLPLSRIKAIMKMDPDVSLVNADAVFLVAKATELFLETVAKEAYEYTLRSKKKTISKKDLDNVIDTVDCLCFLEGAMDF